MDEDDSIQMGFVHRRLPWIIAGVFFVLYFLTVCRWVTSDSLTTVAKVTGWDWSPQVSNPLLYLLTFPSRWLPIGIQPVALNLFGALLGALSIAQLARSVALLPHDRTRDQRQKERSDYSLLSTSTAWMPPLFACLICGLQLTFWEQATAMTGQIVTLFLFAYLIRCLLEYRLFLEDRWLYRIALIYGFAVPSDWAFIGYLPLFGLAMIWIKGGAFFRLSFLLRMAGLGVIGLFTYFLLPVLVLVNDPGAGSFVDILKLQLGSQKMYLAGAPKTVVLLLSLTSILPVFVMGIRFPSSIGDVSVVGAMLSNFMFRAMHVLFLGACTWVAFDPAFSPRNVSQMLPIDFVTFYYLSALAVGYYTGYVLLVFGKAPSHSHRRVSREAKFFNGIVTGLLWLAVIAAPFGLLFQNLPAIRLKNGEQLSQFGQLLVQNLPEERTLVLSDDGYTILMVQSELARQGLTRDYVYVDTASIRIGYYENRLREVLQSRYQDALQDYAFPQQINLLSLLHVMSKLSSGANSIYYLNSSFGLYFEVFYRRQRGLVNELVPYQQDQAVVPPVDAAGVDANQAFWTDLAMRLPKIGAGDNVLDKGSRMLGAWCSREQNVWGATLQTLGRLDEAKAAFERAHRWNPQNICATVNLRQNAALNGESDGTKIGLSDTELQRVQQNYATFEQLLSANGPIDESAFRLLLAEQFARGGNHRQAMLNYQRAAVLAPENIWAKLSYADSLVSSGFAVDAVAEIESIKASGLALEADQKTERIRLEALAHYGIGNRAANDGNMELQKSAFEKAEGILTAGLVEQPANETFLDTLSKVYLFTNRAKEALVLFDRHLVIKPDDAQLLQNKALAHMRLEEFAEAIVVLTKVIEADPANMYAILNRAIAYFQLQQFDDAKSDYLKADELVPNYYAVYFGLGRIAEAAGDTATAIEHMERYLELAPKETNEYRLIAEAVERLKGQ